jgi:flagellar protein FliL
MATEAEQLDEGENAGEPAKGSKKGLILIAIAVLALGGGGFGAWKTFVAKPGASAEEAAPKLPPRYVNIDPPFVVNFEAESMVRFLQVTIDIMTRDPAIETILKDNDPRVRNDLLMILANQTYETVASVEGKETLRKRCLESVRAIVREMDGDETKVEALYFTSFVMQ